MASFFQNAISGPTSSAKPVRTKHTQRLDEARPLLTSFIYGRPCKCPATSREWRVYASFHTSLWLKRSGGRGSITHTTPKIFVSFIHNNLDTSHTRLTTLRGVFCADETGNPIAEPEPK